MRLIPIECIKKGSKLGRTIFDDEGKVLLKAGVELTEQVLKRVEELNILSLYIEDEETSKEIIEDVIKPEIRQKTIKRVKEAFTNVERISMETDINNDITRKLQERRNRQYFSGILEAAKELIHNILERKDVMLALVDIKSLNNYAYQHSVNVAIISLVMGISLKMTEEELTDLCIGALTHDIGKTFIPKEIAFGDYQLSDEDRLLIDTHPRKWYDYLKDVLNFKTSICLVALQHHERIDGKGYPIGIDGSKISLYSKIVAIADTYDTLTSDMQNRRAIPQSQALEYIMAHASVIFDYEMVRVFNRILIAYPNGTIVKLSNGDIALVQKTPPNYPLRPTVKIIKSKNPNIIGRKVDLINQISIVISDIEYNA